MTMTELRAVSLVILWAAIAANVIGLLMLIGRYHELGDLVAYEKEKIGGEDDDE